MGNRGKRKQAKEHALSYKEEMFVLEYLKDFNGTQAVLRAGYKTKSLPTAGIIAHENLKKAKIREKIEEVLQSRREALGINQERVLRELEYIAFARMKSYVKIKGGAMRLIDTDDLEPGADAAIQAYAETTTQHGGSTAIKLYDKVRALELLSKHLKLFDESAPKDSEEKDAETKEPVISSNEYLKYLNISKEEK